MKKWCNLDPGIKNYFSYIIMLSLHIYYYLYLALPEKQIEFIYMLSKKDLGKKGKNYFIIYYYDCYLHSILNTDHAFKITVWPSFYSHNQRDVFYLIR